MSLKFLETISVNGVTEPELFTGTNPTKWKTSGQELHASPHSIEHTPILSYPYISIYGYVGYHEVLSNIRLQLDVKLLETAHTEGRRDEL